MNAIRIGEFITLSQVSPGNQMRYAVESMPLGLHMGDDGNVYRVMREKPLDIYFAYCEYTKQMFELKKLI